MWCRSERRGRRKNKESGHPATYRDPQTHTTNTCDSRRLIRFFSLCAAGQRQSTVRARREHPPPPGSAPQSLMGLRSTARSPKPGPIPTASPRSEGNNPQQARRADAGKTGHRRQNRPLTVRPATAGKTGHRRQDRPPQAKPATDVGTALPRRPPESGVLLDCLDKLGNSGSTRETHVSAINAAGQIGGASIRGKHINTIEKNCRRTRERNHCRVGTVRQQSIRHLDIATIELGERCLDPRPYLDPVRAFINMKDLNAHTPVSLPPGPPGSLRVSQLVPNTVTDSKVDCKRQMTVGLDGKRFTVGRFGLPIKGVGLAGSATTRAGPAQHARTAPRGAAATTSPR